jgi:hypothetical protein
MNKIIAYTLLLLCICVSVVSILAYPSIGFALAAIPFIPISIKAKIWRDTVTGSTYPSQKEAKKKHSSENIAEVLLEGSVSLPDIETIFGTQEYTSESVTHKAKPKNAELIAESVKYVEDCYIREAKRQKSDVVVLGWDSEEYKLFLCCSHLIKRESASAISLLRTGAQKTASDLLETAARMRPEERSALAVSAIDMAQDSDLDAMIAALQARKQACSEKTFATIVDRQWEGARAGKA